MSLAESERPEVSISSPYCVTAAQGRAADSGRIWDRTFLRDIHRCPLRLRDRQETTLTLARGTQLGTHPEEYCGGSATSDPESSGMGAHLTHMSASYFFP